MSVFEFDQQSQEERPDEDERSIKSVTALESKNGDGYATIRTTIPSDYVDEMEISGGDVLLMEHVEGADKITITKS